MRFLRKFLQFKVPAPLKSSKQVIRKALEKELRKEIGKASQDLKAKALKLSEHLSHLSDGDKALARAIMDHTLIKVKQRITKIHFKKLSSLINQQNSRKSNFVQNSTPIVNLSSYKLSKEEEKLLSLGIPMSMHHKTII